MNQKRGEWSHSLIERQVRRADQALLPTLAHSFVACGRARVPHARACESSWKIGEGSGGGKPFVQGWTHTGRRLRRFFQKTVAGVMVVSFLDIEPH